jgi:shikimate kinase
MNTSRSICRSIGWLSASVGVTVNVNEPGQLTDSLTNGFTYALGGGTYAQTGAPEFLKAQSVPVIWLDTPIEILLSRCMTMTGRPLFRDETSFRALYTQRTPSYQLADFRVDSNREPALVVADILRLGIFPSSDASAHLFAEKPRS